MSQVICAADLMLAAAKLTVPAVALNVAKFTLAGLPETAALASVQMAPVITQVLPAGGVSVITVALLKLVNVTVPAETKVLAVAVVTDVKACEVLLLAKPKAPPMPAAPAPLVLFLTVNVAGSTMMSSTVGIAPLKLVMVAPVAVVAALALLL